MNIKDELSLTLFKIPNLCMTQLIFTKTSPSHEMKLEENSFIVKHYHHQVSSRMLAP